MNEKVFFKLGYGLYVLSVNADGRDNGCIINTAIQVTDTPPQLVLTVSKQNLSCEMLQKSGKFNISILTEAAPFDLFKRFGYQSGRKVNKFDDIKFKRAANGVPYLLDGVNGYVSGEVVSTSDLGTHILFIAKVTAGELFDENADSVTYDYYQKYIKPAPKKQTKRGYRCRICGYFYEGDELPADFICPICKHGASDFELVEAPSGDAAEEDKPTQQQGEIEMAVDKNSKTAKNLAYAFAGESQARNKYTYFASVAKKEGYEQIAAIFENTANNEKEHAKLWFKELGGIADTSANLAAAAAGEHEEWTEMYKTFSEEAFAEGYDELGRNFARVAEIEKRHEARYRKLLENIEKGEVWEKTGPRRWECRNCGHIYYGDKAPEVCPTCKHPKAYFEIEAENY